jgi:hypothetical protein
MPEATRDRERHLGVNGEKVRAGLILDAGTRAKMGRLAFDCDYTITAFIEERAERRVRLPPVRSSYDVEWLGYGITISAAAEWTSARVVQDENHSIPMTEISRSGHQKNFGERDLNLFVHLRILWRLLGVAAHSAALDGEPC